MARITVPGGDEELKLAVADQAERLAALLAKNAPEPRERVELPVSDPPALRAFWRAIGWNAKWPQRFRLHHPDVQLSARKLPRLLSQLDEESPTSPALKPGGLPKVCRLADIDRDGIGFIVTNEDDPQRRDDPPMIVVIFDTGEASPVPISYLTWCANELIAVAFSGWLRESVTPAEIPSSGEFPFPTLSPTARLLGPDVWLLPADAYAGSNSKRRVAFARPEDFTSVFGRPPKRQR